MFPDLIKIGDFTIHTYGVMVALGMVASYLVAIYLGKREGIPTSKIENLFIIAIVSGVIGARVFYVVEHSERFNSLFDIIAVWQGGLDWFGGLIFGIIGVLIGLKIYKIPLLKAGDIAGVSIAIGHAIGRIGCTCAGCCYGKPVPENSPFKDFAITFPDHPHSIAPSGIPLYPTQPAEAIGNFLIFVVLFLLYRKKKFDGQIFALYLILYGVERFLLEFWRGVTPPLPIGLNWNQIVSLSMVVVGVLIYLFRMKQTQNETV
ncbi:MAG: prolipoprotein diacylglyceryl transferase [Aquificae bacterium]|nr:prolipoprotein diacylglyceryl transferase [Aquificota bacterium]